MKKKTFLILIIISLAAGFYLTINNFSFDRTNYKVHLNRIGSMSVARAAHQATLLQSGKVLITGGCTGQHCGRILASSEIYDPATQTFNSTAPMHTRRASHIAVLLRNGKVLVAGGWTGSVATASAEVYNPKTDIWNDVGNMAAARVSCIAVPLSDGRIFIMGGGEGRLGNMKSSEIFDPKTSTFSVVGQMQTNHYLATKLKDGKVLMTGGQSKDGKILQTAELFDPVKRKFTRTGNMIFPRVKQASALLNSGKVLIIGGSDGNSYKGRYASTEIYDPVTGIFSLGAEMHYKRHKLRDAVVTLPSGVVLVAGGAKQSELYDPEGNKFIVADGELSGPQMFATATLLTDGNVLVLGGYDEHSQPNSSAWLIKVKKVR